jgi:ribosomal protein S7
MKLPVDVQHEQRWQMAIENLINAAETGGGWLMFARIGMMRALYPDEHNRTLKAR